MSEVFYNVYMKTVSSIFSSAMVPFSAAKSKAIKSQPAIINGAMTAVLAQLTLVESRSVIPLVPALFYGDNLYSIPQDEVGEIIDLKAMKGITSETFFPERQASRVLSGDTENIRQYVSIEYQEGIQYLNIQQNLSNIDNITLSDCNDATDITASLDASNLELNSIQARELSAIDFDLGISNLDGKIVWEIDSLDISGISRDGTIQASVFIPEDLVGNLTSITLTLADEVGFTNTATMSVTENSFGGSFSYGWQPVRFDYRGKTEAGTFDDTVVTHFSMDFIHTLTSAVTGVKVDSIKARKGLGYELHYYNQKHFKDESGVLIEKASKTSDIVIANSDTVELVIQECRKLIDFELRGEDGGSQYTLAERVLNGIYPNAGLYERHRMTHPSEKLPEVANY